jgi:hypothetical protein
MAHPRTALHGRRLWCQSLGLLALALPVSAVQAGEPSARRSWTLERFDALNIAIPADVLILPSAPSAAPSLTVTAEAAVIDSITVKVVQGRLRLTPARPFHTRQAITVELRTPGLSAMAIEAASTVIAQGLRSERLDIDIDAAANLTIEGLNCQHFKLHSQGAGTWLVSGHTVDQQVSISGSGDYRADRLVSDTASIRIQGAADVAVHARQQLDVEITGSGTVSYRGHPARIHKHILGAGSVEPLGEP